MKVNLNMGPCIILTGLFAWGKIVGHLDWSWWAVTSPLWIPPILVIGFLVIAFCIMFLLSFLGLGSRPKKHRRHDDWLP